MAQPRALRPVGLPRRGQAPGPPGPELPGPELPGPEVALREPELREEAVQREAAVQRERLLPELELELPELEPWAQP